MAVIVGGGSTYGGTVAGGINNATLAGGIGTGSWDNGGSGGGAGYLVGGSGGLAGSAGSGDGGAGGVHGYLGAAFPTSASIGTSGGAGENASDVASGAGGGGAGGYGAVLSGSGYLGIQTADLSGGAGGSGGNTYGWFAGDGGRGGIGLWINDTTGVSFTVSAAVTGGAGGNRGTDAVQPMRNGTYGAGGEGIYGTNLSITLTSAGSITGGLSGDGVTRNNAIYFEAGTNLLDIQGGTITGNVQADGTDDTLRLSGSSGGSFDVSTIGSSAQYRGFEHLGSAGSGTWTLTGTNAATQSWSASAGTLLVNGTMENTDFTIGSGATLGGSGTVGDVTIQSGGTIGPGNSPGILTVADLTISGTFEVEISGTTVGTKYDQIVVTGSVTLSGTLDVSFLNAFLPTVGDSFTIIDNQGSDAVTGTFSGLTDGAYFSVGGTYFQIDYDGGTSNDVVLTAVDDGPTESANAGVTVAEGGTVTVAAADLAFTDINQTADNLVYTITSAATNGTLFRNGVALDLNDTFTQDDIDNGLVTYTHDGGETTSASFGFSISDGQGNDVTGQSFAFTVTAVNDAPTDIVLAPRRTLPGGATAVNENVKGAVIGSLSFTDPDTGDTVTYTVDDSRFEIVNDRLRLKSGTGLDYEKASTVDVTVTAEDANGLAYDETFTIHVIDRVDVKVGSAGNDRVIGTEGNDRLFGRQGNDVLKGLGGDDRLRSKLGDDRLWGGDGADTFVFMHNGGHDRIMDFETGIDRIDLVYWPKIANFADVKSHAYMQDGDLWIEAGRDALILKDFHKRDLDAGDFLFAP